MRAAGRIAGLASPALLLVALLACGGAAQAAEARCPGARPLEGTFLQPRAELAGFDDAAWDRLFAEIADLGIEEVFLQWSASDAVLHEGEIRWPKDPRELVTKVLDRASAHGLRVWVGLAYTPLWWGRIDRSRPVESVQVYLRRRLTTNVSAATLLAPLAQEHPAFAGWYLTDEIDDRNWLGPDRQKVLADYLGSLAGKLRELAPSHPISISGFATGFADPAGLAQQWSALLGAAPIDLVLLQDGIGAGHLSSETLAMILPPLRDAIDSRARKLGIVVELFMQTGGTPIDNGPFRAVPAPLARIQSQIGFAHRWATGPVVAFSVPDYMSKLAGAPAAALRAEFTVWQRSCRKPGR